MFNILCFGDSNTFGFDARDKLRFPYNKRWPGILDLNLKEAHVYEDGLTGRTTIFNDPQKLNRSGKETLNVSLTVNRPLDLVIFMLGTNDLKMLYNQVAKTIALGMGTLLNQVHDYPWNLYSKPKCLTIAPPKLTLNAFKDPFSCFNEKSIFESENLAPEFKKVAKAYQSSFLDLSWVPVGFDGIHLNEKGHKIVAKEVERKVNEIL